jgi:hypothetical protein
MRPRTSSRRRTCGHGVPTTPSRAAPRRVPGSARARLDEGAPSPQIITGPTEPHARDLLSQYIAGFENADIAALEKALRTDAAIELVGTRTWFSGKVTCLRYLAHVLGSPGDWLMTPTGANGQPAAATYYRTDDGTHQALGVAVLTATPHRDRPRHRFPRRSQARGEIRPSLLPPQPPVIDDTDHLVIPPMPNANDHVVTGRHSEAAVNVIKRPRRSHARRAG